MTGDEQNARARLARARGGWRCYAEQGGEWVVTSCAVCPFAVPSGGQTECGRSSVPLIVPSDWQAGVVAECPLRRAPTLVRLDGALFPEVTAELCRRTGAPHDFGPQGLRCRDCGKYGPGALMRYHECGCELDGPWRCDAHVSGDT